MQASFPSLFYACILLSKLVDDFFIHLHNKINIYTGYTIVMYTFFWYFITQQFCINYTIKFFYFSFYVFFIINMINMKLYAFNLFYFILKSSYLTNTLSSLIIKDIFFPPLSKYVIYPLI